MVEQVIASKEHALVGSRAGTKRVARCSRKANAALAVRTEQLRELAELVRRVERFYGFPQDVEWAIADGELLPAAVAAGHGVPGALDAR